MDSEYFCPKIQTEPFETFERDSDGDEEFEEADFKKVKSSN
jgi:hypothetical protein